VGRFAFQTHLVVNDRDIKYDTAKCLFPKVKDKEWYKTRGFKEIAIIHGSIEGSYRKTSERINRIRHQEKATPSRTLRDNTEAEGSKIVDIIEYKSINILKDNGFSKEGIFEGKDNQYNIKKAVTLPEEKVRAAIALCEKKLEEKGKIINNPICYEDPEQTVNISIDDVGVKKQKESRQRDGSNDEKKREYVHNTIVHIEKGKANYILNGYGLKNVLRILVAFLINNELLKYRLQFFTDGHRILQTTILKCFCWYKNITIILDWYHLEKKCKERLSLAMKGRDIRNKIVSELCHLLWYGLVDQATEYLRKIDNDLIKNKEELEKLIGYFERNKSYIPCYAARKELGLRNSSNIGEKMNDLVVSDRQKHNGMSWSMPGSVALASITALVRNNEHKRWLEKGTIEFKLAA